jgi:hypothetical protein
MVDSDAKKCIDKATPAADIQFTGGGGGGKTNKATQSDKQTKIYSEANIKIKNLNKFFASMNRYSRLQIDRCNRRHKKQNSKLKIGSGVKRGINGFASTSYSIADVF